MQLKAIHQFHAGSSYGDGITNGMFFTQRILRESGFRSEIYCVDIDPRLAGRILSFRDYQDAQDSLLLLHYSLGTHCDDWIESLRGPRILVYHNITPAHFFAETDGLHRLIESGRRKLAQWGRDQLFIGAIADSSFNADELAGWGFAPMASIGLLVDLDRIRRHGWNSAIAGEIAGARNLLFVGRISAHKGQLNLIRMMRDLVSISDVPVRLLLAGGTTTADYEIAVRDEIVRAGLEQHVRLLGKRDDGDIYALYRLCDLYVSLSQHEGFGMPLVEAMAFDLPVLAADAGSVAATLGTGGIVLNNGDSATVAAMAKTILQEPALRGKIIAGQRQSLARYERPVLVEALESFLRSLGFEVDLAKRDAKAVPESRAWSVEGPYDSSYSLAIVNRELARGLERAGEAVTLLSRDGPGPFAPNARFLAENPDLAAMVARGEAGASIDVTLRNQYPPLVADMRGETRVLANYAWEESGFPAAWVDEFNCSLDLVTVTSRYVAKVLRDNGVHTPIAVVGNGIDQVHALGTAPRAASPSFRFLHVSSGFPRKGVDVLLAAWGKAFTKASAVELVIKTFPNPHNEVASELLAFRAAYPDHAPVVMIDRDLPPDALGALYSDADAVVCPTRGEGFGLPMAEALVLGKPVVTSAYGGQTDFCTPETAWLCDYSFAAARNHLGVPDSVWVEPDVDSLVAALRDCHAADPAERDRRAAAGRDLLLSQFSWDHVAARTRTAVDAVRAASSGPALTLPRIGWVSSWNSRCGIAAYSRSLTCEIEPGRLAVFADTGSALLGDDERFVQRCWAQGWTDPLDELYDAICTAKLDAVVIQFNFGFFQLAALARLIGRLKRDGIIVMLCLHSTADVIKPDITIRLAEIASALTTVDRILVHSVHDLNRLKRIGLIDNVALFPMGLPQPFDGDIKAIRARHRLGKKTVIASFGYLLPHKGLRELLQAFALLRKARPDAHLLMLNALYPAPESDNEGRALRGAIAAAGLADHVSLVSEFLPEAEVIERLGAADVIVYPYQNTQESASAAVKMGLAALVPIACTPLDIFADIAGVSHALPGVTPSELADGLTALLAKPHELAELRERQRDWVAAHQWPTLSRRLANMIRGEFRAQAVRAEDQNGCNGGKNNYRSSLD